MSKIPRPITFLFLTYLTGILFFFLFRIVLISINYDAARAVPAGDILIALFMGFRFDTVISGYILALPAVLFLCSGLISGTRNMIERISFIWIYIFYTVSFFICTADLPYFLQYNSRITAAILNWTDTPGMMLKIVFQDTRNYIYLGMFFIAAYFFYAALKKIRNKTVGNKTAEQDTKFTRIVFYSVTLLLLFAGIRGRLSHKSPIRWGTAFFSQHLFANQLGLNPVFTFSRSWLDARKPENAHLKLMDERTAYENARKYLGISNQRQMYSPIARRVSSAGPEKKYNVILIVMESMGAARMGISGNPYNHTPYLDSLAKSSIFFSNFYSSGMHTFNGIYSTLIGMPSLPGKQTMKDLESQQPFSGIAKALSQKNYSTIFFCTHDEEFDNMGGFFTANGFREIVGQKDYPAEKVLSTLGVPDHVMFDLSLPYLEKLHQKDQPFFAAYLTGSDHPPYILPKDIPFHPESKDIKQKMAEYADWSVHRFLEQCRQRSWADSTIFIITADHGSLLSPVYDADLSMVHTFLIMHAPAVFDKPREITAPGGQIDIFPTLMGVLGMSYINNTPGIDLLREERPFIYFCIDENTGCINNEYYLIMRKNGDTSLYRYHERSTKNYLPEMQSLADSMKTYAESNLQTVQDMILHRVVY